MTDKPKFRHWKLLTISTSLYVTAIWIIGGLIIL